MMHNWATDEIAFMQVMNRMQKRVHQTAKSKGWHDDIKIPEKLMLIVSEVSEALEAWREQGLRYGIDKNGKPYGFESELADTMIRIMDLAEYYKIPLARRILEKDNYNQTREYKHGGKRA